MGERHHTTIGESMRKLAFVFAGQGSQYVGMGCDFIEAQPELLKLEQQANDVLGYQTREIMSSDLGFIHQTRYTQPLVMLSSIYALESIKQLNIKPDAVLGFSLGEYTALYAAGLFSFQEILDIVKVRASLMDEQTMLQPGKMAALLGLSREQVELLCQEVAGVYPANFNSPIQTVISGRETEIDLAIEKAKALGAKRALKLNVSGAFHSPLMKDAALKFEAYLKDIPVKDPVYDVYLNTTAQKLNLVQLKSEMVKQIYSSVRFVEAILNMKEEGYTHFLEIGPGSVLSGLIKKIDQNLEVAHIEREADIHEVKGWLKDHGFIK